MQAAGRKAVAGTDDDVREFIRTGQYTAREADDRVLATQAVATGGPEVKAAGRAALVSPPSYVRTFVESGLYRAQQRDALTATHRAEVAGYVSDAAQSAALARQNAFDAARAAAIARGAADDAARYASEAEKSAAEAQTYSNQASASAAEAKKSAEAAVASAKQATDAEARAAQAARSAQKSASQAQASASDAAGSASSARSAANDAAKSAQDAGRSRDEAVQAAADAWKRAGELYFREMFGGPPDLSDEAGHPYADDEAGHPLFHEPNAMERYLLRDAIRLYSNEQVAAGLIACLNRPISCELFRHWAGKSGEDYVLSGVQMRDLFSDPQWAADLRDKLERYAKQAAVKCTGPIGTTCALKLDTNWMGMQFTEVPDHIFSLHSFDYRVTGDLSARVTGDGQVQLSGSYRVDLKKQYNFDADKPPILVHKVPYNVKDLSQMPAVGLARDYTVVGSTNQYVDLPGHR